MRLFISALILCSLLVGQEKRPLSPSAVQQIEIANLKQQLAEAQAEIALLRKQGTITESNAARLAIVTQECHDAKIPIEDCRYDYVKQEVSRVPIKAEAK